MPRATCQPTYCRRSKQLYDDARSFQHRSRRRGSSGSHEQTEAGKVGSVDIWAYLSLDRNIYDHVATPQQEEMTTMMSTGFSNNLSRSTDLSSSIEQRQDVCRRRFEASSSATRSIQPSPRSFMGLSVLSRSVASQTIGDISNTASGQ